MFESWAQILFFVSTTMFAGVLGYLISELLSLSRKKKARKELEDVITQIEGKLKEIENSVGIKNEKLSHSSIRQQLQFILRRLSGIAQNLRKAGVAPERVIRNNSDQEEPEKKLGEDEINKEEEDNKNWAAFRQWSEEKEREKYSVQQTTQEKLIKLYNQAIEQRELRDTLWLEFSITQIENINAVDQRLGNTVEPEFRQSESGNFYAIENLSERNFLVVPKFDFTVKQTNYESTIRFVFECQNFDGKNAYSQVHVLRPAVFLKIGNVWKPSLKGLLRLNT